MAGGRYAGEWRQATGRNGNRPTQWQRQQKRDNWNEKYCTCQTPGCTGWAKVSRLSPHELTCIKCHALYPKDYIPDSLIFYWNERAAKEKVKEHDEQDKASGADATAAHGQPQSPETAALQEKLATLSNMAEMLAAQSFAIPADLHRQMQDIKEQLNQGEESSQKTQSAQEKELQKKQNKVQAELRAANKEEETIKEQLRLARHRVQELEYSAISAEKKVVEKRQAVKEVAAEVLLLHQNGDDEEEEEDDDDDAMQEDGEQEHEKEQAEHVQKLYTYIQQMHEMLKAANCEVKEVPIPPTAPPTNPSTKKTTAKGILTKGKIKAAQAKAEKAAKAAVAAAEQAAKDKKNSEEK